MMYYVSDLCATIAALLLLVFLPTIILLAYTIMSCADTNTELRARISALESQVDILADRCQTSKLADELLRRIERD